MSDDNLDFWLRKAIRSGLNYLSLSSNHTNPKEGKWVGCYRHVETNNCQYITADDPMEALLKAIKLGESEAKRLRKFREETLEPLREHTEKIQRSNLASVAKKKAEEEAARAKAATKRRRDMEDLV